MKTTPLPEILKQITPLPLKVDRAGVNIIDPREKSEYVLAYCKGSTLAEVQSNAAYLAHAANVLPELVEAGERMANRMADLLGKIDDFYVDALDADIQEFRRTLSLATAVPVNS